MANNLACLALERNECASAVRLVAENLDAPAVRADRTLVLEGGVVGLALMRLGLIGEATVLAQEIEVSARDHRGVMDVYVQRMFSELLAEMSPSVVDGVRPSGNVIARIEMARVAAAAAIAGGHEAATATASGT